jgi:SAM-dependent methyltransferase
MKEPHGVPGEPARSGVPKTRADFDRAYRLPFTFWGDPRVPPEVKALGSKGAPRTVLELGCGVGRFSRYLARKGLRATGVDFSAVAIAKARARVAEDDRKPEFLVGDVTDLNALRAPFDVSFDVGCFHCLDLHAQERYASEVFRLLVPGGTHLIWALDDSPGGAPLSSAVVKTIFAPRLRLESARETRRRIVRSHWYWLVRS